MCETPRAMCVSHMPSCRWASIADDPAAARLLTTLRPAQPPFHGQKPDELLPIIAPLPAEFWAGG